MRGVSFDNIHSAADLGLVLSSVSIPPAQPKQVFVDLPGANGSVDMSEATGGIKFADRVCTFVFSLLPHDDFEQKKMEVSNAINGRRMQIRLDKDPGFYYEGRVSVSDYASSKMLRQITVSATVSPYKLHNGETAYNFALTGTPREISLPSGRMPIVPVAVVSGAATIINGGSTYNLSNGTHKILGLQLHEGENRMTISGSGSINFRYRKGEL